MRAKPRIYVEKGDRSEKNEKNHRNFAYGINTDEYNISGNTRFCGRGDGSYGKLKFRKHLRIF